MANYADWLRLYSNDDRKHHALRVAETAKNLAAIHGADKEKVFIAGILHDIARDYSGKQLLETAEQFGIVVNDSERNCPVVLHGPVAAKIAGSRLRIEDKDILQAIHQHTLAAPAMSLVSKIVYLADVIEPGRQFKAVGELRELARYKLDSALLAAMDSGINYLLGKKEIIHPKTIEARNYYILHCR